MTRPEEAIREGLHGPRPWLRGGQCKGRFRRPKALVGSAPKRCSLPGSLLPIRATVG